MQVSPAGKQKQQLLQGPNLGAFKSKTSLFLHLKLGLVAHVATTLVCTEPPLAVT